MADTTEAKPTESPAKKGPPIKAIGLVAALMVAEAVGVVLFVGMTGAKPQAASAHELTGLDHADAEETVEIALIEDRFQNLQTGRVWIWDTEIVLKVKTRNEEYVNRMLEKRAAEIKEGVAMAFRRAPHAQLKEPGLETINHQLTAYLNQTLGKDPDGKERIERVVIPKCKGFPAD